MKLALLVLFACGVVTGVGLRGSIAHTPCDNLELIKKPCKHVLVVNPYTGKMETQYVCQ